MNVKRKIVNYRQSIAKVNLASKEKELFNLIASNELDDLPGYTVEAYSTDDEVIFVFHRFLYRNGKNRLYEERYSYTREEFSELAEKFLKDSKE